MLDQQLIPEVWLTDGEEKLETRRLGDFVVESSQFGLQNFLFRKACVSGRCPPSFDIPASWSTRAACDYIRTGTFDHSRRITMVYFSTSEEWQRQSALLLQARPTTVRKYVRQFIPPNTC